MIANQNGVKVAGILGVLIQAKKRGVIPLVKPYIDKLIEVGFRLDPKLIQKVLKKLEE